jgi:glucosyl-3-phosphoglycerate synthase
VARLVEVKGRLRVSVCLPALNEVGTIGAICEGVRPLLQAGLVDELVVMDSGSTDGTRQAARAAGATVFSTDEVLPEISASGKGGALWKSLRAVRGDVVVWLDSDVRNFGPSFVVGLLTPLLTEDGIRMSKAFYDRPLEVEGATLATGGARVTELVVRPLAHLLFPELTGFVQPLSGEYAGFTRDLAELPFFTGYGVEVGLLIDFIQRHGLEKIAQVDLGSRRHRNQEILALGRMSFEVMTVMMRRAEDLGRVKVAAVSPDAFVQFEATEEGPRSLTHRITVTELPPMKDVG